MNSNPLSSSSSWKAGVARRTITPPSHVELAGLGYYLNRTSERVQDDLAVTALVLEDRQGQAAAVLAVDLMYSDETFTRSIRERVCAKTNLRPDAICVNCSHSHNAPTAGFIRGAGEVNPEYLKTVIDRAVDAAVEAWNQRQPATLRVGKTAVEGLTINRTREQGPVDTCFSLLRVDTLAGKPLAVALNFHSHLTAHFEVNMRAISRDWPGEVIDQIEEALPGVTALYLQGTCGDVNLRPEFNNTERRFEPARILAQKALQAWEQSRPVAGDSLKAAVCKVQLPTRRWTREEIMRDREESLYRLKTGDTTDWLNGFAKVIVGVPHRLPLRYGGDVGKTVAAVCRFGVEWTDAMLPVLETRPEYVETEVQALRVGDVWFVAHSAELFSTLGLEVRRRWPHENLFILGYSNGSLGYLPDAHDIERKSYAAYQSPKFTGQFPFTVESGNALVKGMLKTLEQATGK